MTSSTFTANWRLGGVFDIALEVVEDRPGYLAFRVTGRDAVRAFQHEAGGHRWQGVSPTDKRKRVHTSTVTVAVLREPSSSEIKLKERDLEWKTCRGSGAGGQHRNVTDSAVQLTHLPTKIQVRAEAERSQHQNKELAKAILRARLQEAADQKNISSRNAKRKKQVGGGARGDKRRTIALQRGQVTDHETGKTISAKKYLRGGLPDLW